MSAEQARDENVPHDAANANTGPSGAERESLLALRPTLCVSRAMSQRPLALPADLHVREACTLMRLHAAQEVLVMPSAWSPSEAPVLPIGILTESDALELLTRREPALDAPLSSVMKHPVRTVNADDDLCETLELMRDLQVHRLPVIEHGKLVGLLTSDSVLEAQAGHVDELKRHADRLEEKAFHDPLTGLANRHLFAEVLERELSLQDRGGAPLGLLMIDVDHFKAVNDAHGHPAGDAVLRELADRMRASVRRADLVARVGGEEFAVVATADGVAQLRHFAEKLRLSVAKKPFSVPSGRRPTPLTATISVGGALAERTPQSGAELVRLADEALYEAKRSGRNTTRICGERAW